MMPDRLKQLTLVLLCSAAVAACSGPRQIGGDPQLKILGGTELPTPHRADVGSSSSPYYIGPFDRVTIDVFGIDELSNREVQVDASGQISFPLAGVVDVNGLVPEEVEGKLAARLRQAYVRDPQVTVNLKETLSQFITVEGEVKKPGLYPVVGRLSLLGAMAKAEGTDEFSRLDDVVIFRTVSGQRYAAIYNLDAIRHGAYPDPEVYARDVIMVGESRARRIFKDILAISPALVTPTIVAVDRLTR